MLNRSKKQPLVCGVSKIPILDGEEVVAIPLRNVSALQKPPPSHTIFKNSLGTPGSYFLISGFPIMGRMKNQKVVYNKDWRYSKICKKSFNNIDVSFEINTRSSDISFEPLMIVYDCVWNQAKVRFFYNKDKFLKDIRSSLYGRSKVFSDSFLKFCNDNGSEIVEEAVEELSAFYLSCFFTHTLLLPNNTVSMANCKFKFEEEWYTFLHHFSSFQRSKAIDGDI